MALLPPPPACKSSKRVEATPGGDAAWETQELAVADLLLDDEIGGEALEELEPEVEPEAEVAVADTRPAAETRPVYRELPSTASVIRPVPLSESTWSVAALVDDGPRPRRSGWWRYTLVSAGATALVCSLGFTLTGQPSAATAAPAQAEPVVVAYDPSVLAENEAGALEAERPQISADSVLARRIALRGTRNLEAGRSRLAREAFEQALAHDPDCRPALAGLGRIHFAAGRHRKAADYLAPAVQIEPRDPELQRMLAQAYREIGHHNSAERHERLAARHGG